MVVADAKPIARRNEVYHTGFPILDADGDLVAGATGLDSEVSTESGGFADASGEAVEETTSSGMYELSLTAAEMDGNLVIIPYTEVITHLEVVGTDEDHVACGRQVAER